MRRLTDDEKWAILEAKLSTAQRNELSDSKFGVPELRDFPLTDASHVKSAISYFHKCDDKYKAELAKNIKIAAKKYGVDINPNSQVATYKESADIVLQEADKKEDKKNPNDDPDSPAADYSDDIDNDPDDTPDYTDGADNQDDSEPDVNNDDQSPDYTSDDDTNDPNTDNSDTNNTNNEIKSDGTSSDGTPSTGEGDTTEEDEPTDYTTDDDEPRDEPDGDNATGGSDADDGDNQQGDSSTDIAGDQGDTSGDAGADSEVQQLQSDVFSNLTDAQLQIRINNIKDSFIDLYNNISDTSNKLIDVNRSSENIKTINFLNETLAQLKGMVRDSLTVSFSTKSLVENQVILQKFIAIYSLILHIIEKIASKEENNNKEDKD